MLVREWLAYPLVGHTLLQVLVFEVRENFDKYVHKTGNQSSYNSDCNENDPSHKVLFDQRVLLLDDLLLEQLVLADLIVQTLYVEIRKGKGWINGSLNS